MVLLNLFQLLQAVLAVILLVCVFKKAHNKREFHIALVCLVVSIMIIPPFGREYVNGATIEGASSDSPVDFNTCMSVCGNNQTANCDEGICNQTVNNCKTNCKSAGFHEETCKKMCVTN